MIRKTEKSIVWAGGLLLGAAAVALTVFPGGAGAQGWTTEVSDIEKAPAKARKGREKPAAAASKAKARREAAKSDPAKSELSKNEPGKTEPAKIEAAKAGAVAVPAAAATATAMEAAKAEPAPAPAAAAEPAKPEEAGKQAASAPAKPVLEELTAADIAAELGDEPDDPFADLQVTNRPAENEVLTTQVVPPPTETAPPTDRGAASQYCTNIADAAIDARIAWQRQNLAEAEKEVQRRTTELEAKTAEYQRWLTRRDQFAEKAQKAVIDIYSKMKPDAAAAQLQALDDETAAAVLIKLDARVASSVMNEMEPVQAARLTAILSGAAKGPGRMPRQSPPAGNRS